MGLGRGPQGWPECRAGRGLVVFRGPMGSEEPGQRTQDFLMSNQCPALISVSLPCALSQFHLTGRTPLLGLPQRGLGEWLLGCSACHQRPREDPCSRLCCSPEPLGVNVDTPACPMPSRGEVYGRRFRWLKIPFALNAK